MEAALRSANLPMYPVTDHGLSAQVARYARCADSSLNPDEWFPVSIEPAMARREAAAAIAVCAGCQVRTQCLALSLRHWDIGRHGIWGGLIAADRARLRRRLPANHSARQGATDPGTVVRPPIAPALLRVMKGGDVRER